MVRLFIIILLTALPIGAFSNVHRVRGAWEDTAYVWTFSRDTVVQTNKRTSATVRSRYALESRNGQTRMFLIVSRYRPDLKCVLTLGIPFALLRYEGNGYGDRHLLLKTVETEGILIRDYPLFPWPEFVAPYKVLRPVRSAFPCR